MTRVLVTLVAASRVEVRGAGAAGPQVLASLLLVALARGLRALTCCLLLAHLQGTLRLIPHARTRPQLVHARAALGALRTLARYVALPA